MTMATMVDAHLSSNNRMLTLEMTTITTEQNLPKCKELANGYYTNMETLVVRLISSVLKITPRLSAGEAMEIASHPPELFPQQVQRL